MDWVWREDGNVWTRKGHFWKAISENAEKIQDDYRDPLRDHSHFSRDHYRITDGKAGRPNSGTLPAGTAQFDGKYAIDSYTEYEFDGAGKGALCLGNTTRYIFDYSVHGDKVTFDYEDVKIPDMVYTYRFKGDDIIITLGDTDIEYTLAKENG